MTGACFGDLGGVKGCWGYKLKLVRSKEETKDTLFEDLRQFTLKELEKITNHFSTRIGEGGFSTSFKGTLENGTLVMVLMFLHSEGDVNRKKDSDLASLINKLSKIRHRNVVELIGCCLTADRVFMIYEFVGDYNLEYLFSKNLSDGKSRFGWDTRASICIGIARGLEYLHGGVSQHVVHRDIKPSNIVLDDHYNPKIVDFGLVELFDNDEIASCHSGRVVGTYGYIDPEYMVEGRYTVKSDVYGFGMILLEVISGVKASEFLRARNGNTLVSWVWGLRETGRVLEIVDPTLSDFPEDQVKRFIDVALWCVQSSSNLRPSMSEALLMLLGPCDLSNKVLTNPDEPFWSSYHDEVNSPIFDGKSREEKVAEAISQANADPANISRRVQEIRRDQRDPTTTSMSKNTRGFETEIETDFDTDSSASARWEITHEQVTELYTSIEANISTAASVSGPSASMKPEIVSPSSPSASNVGLSSFSTDTHAFEETANRAEEILICDDEEAELEMGQPSVSDYMFGSSAVKVGMNVTSSLEIASSIPNEAVEVLSFPAEIDGVLSDAIAWDVFSCKVGDIIDSPDIKPYAQAISKECYGSSVIISAIGAALRAESSVEEWKLALRNLQFGGDGDTANSNNRCIFRRHIKYCFDRLKARDLKTCFLYTALFQEGKEIDKSTLVECFINEGLVGGTAATAYKKGHDIIEHLTNASLLEANDNGLAVKMHNAVRESALEILSSNIAGFRVFVKLLESEKDEEQYFEGNDRKWSDDMFNIQLPSSTKYLTMAGAHLKESPSVEDWEQATMIFLMDNELSRLPSKPNCTTLVALLLQRNIYLRVIPASFFDSMPALKILNLSKTRIKSLPDSFSKLSSLQILLLRDCERLLVLPPSIELLKSLEVLDLQGTDLTHLPDSVGELARLKLLRVSFYGSMNRSEYKKLPTKLISEGIISGLGLREFGVFVYPGDRRWALNASNMTKEISNLELSVLCYHFPKVEDLEYFLRVSQSWKEKYLTTFNIVVGHDFKRIVSLLSNDAELLFNGNQKSLRFVNGENIHEAVIEVLTRTNSFCLDHHLNISYLSQFGIHSLDGLKICILRDCRELIGMVDSQERGRIFLPALEYLSISSLWNFKSLWAGHVATGSLARLRSLSVHACLKLRHVFTCSMLENLLNLEELVIEDCVSLKYVVVKDEDVEILYSDATSEVVDMRAISGDPIKENVKQEQFIALECLRSLKVLKLHYLPELCGIWQSQWPSLEYISFYNCPKIRNLHMAGDDDVLLKEIAADKAWWDSLEWDDHELSRRLHKLVTQSHFDE